MRSSVVLLGLVSLAIARELTLCSSSTTCALASANTSTAQCADSCSADVSADVSARPLFYSWTPSKTRTWVPPAPKPPGVPSRRYNPSLRLKLVVHEPAETLDGYERFQKSLIINQFGADDVLFVPNDVELGSTSFKELLDTLKLSSESSDDVVLFIRDPKDAIVVAEQREILRRFQDADTQILFGAQRRCRARCAFDWPEVKEDKGQARFLDTNSFIGYAPAVLYMLSMVSDPHSKIKVTTDDHFLTFYLDAETRAELGISADSNHTLFQNLYGYNDEFGMLGGVFSIQQETRGVPDPRLQNLETDTLPCILRGGGNGKLLSQLGNYMPMRFVNGTCHRCLEAKPLPDPAPTVLLGFDVLSETSFLEVLLDALAGQDYPGTSVHMRITLQPGPSADKYAKIVNHWLSSNQGRFASVKFKETAMTPGETRRFFITEAKEVEAKFVFNLDSHTWLRNSTAMRHLVALNLRVVAPFVNRQGMFFSNFWGSTKADFESQCFDDNRSCPAWAKVGECTSNEAWMAINCRRSCGFCASPSKDVADLDYARSFDYFDIAGGDKRGVWTAPYVSTGLLLRSDVFERVEKILDDVESEYSKNHWLVGGAVALGLRQQDVHLHVDNRNDCGLMIDNTQYDHTKLYPDLFLVDKNKDAWGARYLHKEYSPKLELDFVQGRCWDIYNFPLFNEDFCWRFINESESYGGWSGGTNYDKRLQGGYEPVPTRDIHFYQYGFQESWKSIVKHFVAPLAERVWVGYHYEGRASLDFIVKYEPHGQPNLRPHHDASTFSLNVALNRIGIDFEGGGTKFHRQNCTVLDNKQGWALFHPGRLTHQHEGLHVTNGTRYIIVSFVDQ